jgi:hypothetical protein
LLFNRVISSDTIWPYSIENCQNEAANFYEQYQPILWNVPGLIASISDQWSIVPWNYLLVAENPQLRSHSDWKTVNIDFSASIVRRTRSESSSSRLNEHLFEKFFHTTRDSLPI